MRKRKIISVAVLVCMLVSMLPVPLFAAEADMPAVEGEALTAPEGTESSSKTGEPEGAESSSAAAESSESAADSEMEMPKDTEDGIGAEPSETGEEREFSEEEKPQGETADMSAEDDAGETSETTEETTEETAEGFQEDSSDIWEDLEEEILELADDGDPAVSGSCGANLNWAFDESTGTLHISGTGEMEDYVGAALPPTPWYHLKDSITKVVIGDGVTSIGDASFYRCDKITDVRIPESVTDIGQEAFFECKSLIKVEIPKNVESIGMSAFMDCQKLTEVILPEGLSSVGEFSFSMCASLVKAVIPESVTSIGQSAFSSSPIQELTIPNRIGNIGSQAFDGKEVTKLTITGTGDLVSYGKLDGCWFMPWDRFNTMGETCDALQEVILCDGITGISDGSFAQCENLVRVEIPDSVTKIEDRAFMGCLRLKEISVPDSVESIGQEAFSHCESLAEIRVPEGITNIPWMAFSDCTNLKRADIPESVTSIEYSAFIRCGSLENVILPEGLISVGQAAFSNCGSLTKLVVPESVEQIEEEAFQDCLLTELTLPNGIENLSPSAFDGNSVKKLTITGSGELVNYKGMNDGCFYFAPWRDGAKEVEEVTIGSGITGIDVRAFCGCEKLTHVEIPDTVTHIEESAFSGCLGLREIVIPDSVTFMAERVFEACENLASVKLPSQIASIEERTFDRCNLTSAEIPAGVTSIGERAFAECQALERLILPEGLESIGGYAFSSCGHLTSLVIPDSVTRVGDRAFEECEISDLTLPNNASYSEQTPFYGNPLEKVTITGTGEVGSDIVSVVSLGNSLDQTYRELVISRGITGIGDSAFTGGGGFAKIEIPDTVTHVGKNAFWMNGTTDTIILPDSITSIGEGAFSECMNLTQIHIPEKITRIENRTFSGCGELTSIDIPDSVTYIGNSAFGDCPKLQEVVIPDQVKTIGAYAFSDCTELKKIVILDNVTEFEERVFDRSSNVTIYGYPGSKAETYANMYQIPFVPLTKPEKPDPEDPDKPGTEDTDPDKPGTEDPEGLSISDCTITMPEERYVYDGTAKTPKPVVKFGDETLTEDQDYVAVYVNNTNAGMAAVTVIGMGDFSGGEKKVFSISPKEIEDLHYRYFEEVSYRGLELRPGVAITYGSLTLKNLTDYVLNYENNREVGTASVTITGTGNYKGVKKLDFTIAPKPISSTLARLDTYSFLSDGKEKTPEVIIMNGKDRLTQDQDYALTYVNNIKPGIGVAFIEGTGNFTGTLQLKFTIRMATPVLKKVESTSSGIKISWKKVAQAESYKLFRRVKDTGKWEIAANLTGTSYTDKKAKVNGRTYQYKVYGVADGILSSPSGFRTICYLSRPEISGVASGKAGQITVKWKRNKKAEGYEIQYATKKDFSNAKKVSVSGGKTVKKNVTKLKKNQKYYIRIRSFTRSFGEYYSPWSAKKSLKTAK